MKTIAREAGVQLTTVSCILNNKGGKYSEQTRAKVLAVAERLKYRPNALIRSMQTGRSQMAGVMVPAEDSFYSRIVTGIHAALQDAGALMLLNWNYRTEKPADEAKERSIIHRLIEHRVDGFILRPSTEAFQRSYFEEIWERGMPLVLVDREMSTFQTDFAGTADETGGQLAAGHLLALGHRDMLYVGNRTVSTSLRRETGFRRVLSGTPGARCRSIQLNESGLREALVDELGQRETRPTAVFCVYDGVAREVLAVAREIGLSIPGDLSILGFGNIPSNDGGVALSTFEQHPEKVGAAAVEIYLARVNGQSAGVRPFIRSLIEPTLLVRDSTGVPSSRATPRR